MPTRSVSPSPSVSQIYAKSNVSLVYADRLATTVSASLPSPPFVRPVKLPYISPLQGVISDITAPSVNSGCCQMRAPLSRDPRRSRLFDITIASDILASTKPLISDYSLFSL